MEQPDYTIIRCQTKDKNLVMNLLCDANEYKIVRDHVDVVYHNGDNIEEKQDTIRIVKANVAKLTENGIQANSKPEYLNDWQFLQLH